MSNHLPHTATSLVFSCMDDRLTHAHAKLVASLDGGAFTPTMAGGGFAFINEDDRPSAIKQVVAAYKINRITTVYLESHTECGAYRLGGITFESPEQEIERLTTDLGLARQIVKEALIDAGASPDELTINLRIVDPAGQIVPLATKNV